MFCEKIKPLEKDTVEDINFVIAQVVVLVVAIGGYIFLTVPVCVYPAWFSDQHGILRFWGILDEIIVWAMTCIGGGVILTVALFVIVRYVRTIFCHKTTIGA